MRSSDLPGFFVPVIPVKITSLSAILGSPIRSEKHTGGPRRFS